jgi:hypothetical protein
MQHPVSFEVTGFGNRPLIKLIFGMASSKSANQFLLRFLGHSMVLLLCEAALPYHNISAQSGTEQQGGSPRRLSASLEPSVSR